MKKHILIKIYFSINIRLHFFFRTRLKRKRIAPLAVVAWTRDVHIVVKLAVSKHFLNSFFLFFSFLLCGFEEASDVIACVVGLFNTLPHDITGHAATHAAICQARLATEAFLSPIFFNLTELYVLLSLLFY